MIVNLKTVVPDKLICPENVRRVELVDAGGTGLYCEVRATAPGEGTYYLRYKDANGKTCHQKIGRTTDIDLNEARQRAKKLKAEITLGKDPRADDKARKAVPTFGDFFKDHYLPHAKMHNRGWKKKSQMYDLRLKNAFGNKRLDQIKRHEISAWHVGLREDGLSPAYSDRFLALLRNILNKAIEFEILEKSPAMGVKMFNPDNRVNHFLNEEEMKRLITTLNDFPNRTPALIALFALSTGMRIGEVLKIRWSDIDLGRKLLQIPASNAKAKHSRTVPLNQSALNAIAQSNTQGRHEYLWVNGRSGKPYVDIKHAWQTIRVAAGLPHLRIHDLRHQFASILLNRGVSAVHVKELLGHAQITTTISRYSHLATDQLLSSSNQVCDALNCAMEVEKSP